MLRAHGVQGLGGEDAILEASLVRRFQTDDPSRWRFRTHAVGCDEAADANRKKPTPFQRLQVRQQNLPSWRSVPLAALLQGHGCCKERFARPDSFLFEHRQEKSTVSDKRHRVQAEARDQYEPKSLQDSICTTVGISLASLPAHLRPGKRFVDAHACRWQ